MEEEGIELEETQILHWTQGDSEEEEETEEKMLKDMLRNEANQKEVAGRQLLESDLRDVRRLEDEAVMEGQRCRDAAMQMCERAERRRDSIRDSANVMLAAVTRKAAALRVKAAYLFEENKEEVKELRKRIERLRLRRLTEKEERRRESPPIPPSTGQAALSPKPVVVVALMLVPPLKFRLPPIEEEEALMCPDCPPPTPASREIVDISSEEKFL